MSKKVIVLGAGYAGIEAALTLQKKKKKEDDIEITIIDKNTYHTLLTELHEVAGNRIREEGVIVPLRDIFKYSDVKIVQDEINGIDFENNKLLSSSREYHYDYLILAAGSEPNFFGIPGIQEHAFTIWSYEQAIRIREHIRECFVKASQEQDKAKREQLLCFVVGGGGFTGVETIGEIANWVKQLCREYGVDRNEVKLILVEALGSILTNLKERGAKKSMDYLVNKLGVEVLLNSAVSSVTADHVEIKTGRVIPTKTLIWTAGVKANSLAEKLDINRSRASRIVVNEYAQTQYKNVYSVGDISAFSTGENQILPALVESAMQTGKGAALNILADIRGKEKEKIKPKLHGVMVSVGAFFAQSNIMGRELPTWLSILMKYMVNIHYLFGIGGFELVIRYLKDELLFKQQDKFLLEKHYSVMTPAFWLVPIRLFLGYKWLMEGIEKVQQGWFTKALLAGLPGADAGSSASVTDTGETVFRIISEHTPGWYAWIATNIVIPNAILFQVLIVLAEIGIGLALLSGTFTFIAALGSLALNVNFLLSTGMYEYDWWFIPAALCLLGGAGRAFGVDHYLMPYLMKQWRYFVRNRKIKLWLR